MSEEERDDEEIAEEFASLRDYTYAAALIERCQSEEELREMLAMCFGLIRRQNEQIRNVVMLLQRVPQGVDKWAAHLDEIAAMTDRAIGIPEGDEDLDEDGR